MNVNQKNEITVSIFKDRIFFFYKIIFHSNVLFSLILKTSVDIIYTFFFGFNGRRDLSVFRFTAAALSEMMLSHFSSDEEFFIIVISSSLAVLDRLIEINQNAQIIENFIAIVETIFACFFDNFMISKAQQNFIRIRCRLNIDFSLFLASIQLISQNLLSAVFELNENLLENFFNDDIRHDNDHASIVNIQILFIAQKIAFSRHEYFSSINSTQHHLSGLAEFLNKQFRLLREDTVKQLRNAVREIITKLQHSNRDVPTTHQNQQGVRKLIYHNVRFFRMCINRRMDLQVIAEFDQFFQTCNKLTKQRKE